MRQTGADSLTARARLGRLAEQMAADDLTRRGYKIISRNFTVNGVGELDLVCHKDSRYIFVEVRARSSAAAYGGAAASLTPAKLRRFFRMAAIFRQRYALESNECIFVAAVIDHPASTPTPQIQYIHLDQMPNHSWS